ncbi:XRE family transcriptional regulator [Sphingomonas koreensis]|uniref:XRE family transcriptional regulator n=1 Tax=Sphingomonas koreensis TaxID=93064 RepID=A0A1L6JBS9_9SPHN|nr:hypothetical protein [Sphingomonas koreensis]APR53343.1 hypothetical protein BRX40_13710 [Sphingomonas koreensis]MDC7809965.1 XRE family transcriptional regulator [Sphingomonas koreensis]RSU24537.1 XRE family transcriptional regulator [Sphingomonas koreensis]RSU25182.1 XRE family transcriptional regulator [Sphingomonas koreensis]RSU30143.1 XRE family transcriptional regulator [Sphingomonas koreensis]
MPNDLPSPGTYLRMRREAQGLSLDDVAGLFHTQPPVSLASRADLLRSIEADLTPIDDDVVMPLIVAAENGSYRFDPLVLIRLVDLHAGSKVRFALPRLCDKCACSEQDACVTRSPGRFPEACGWIGANRCSACGPDDGDCGEAVPPPANEPVNDVQSGSVAA